MKGFGLREPVRDRVTIEWDGKVVGEADSREVAEATADVMRDLVTIG